MNKTEKNKKEGKRKKYHVKEKRKDECNEKGMTRKNISGRN